MRVRGLLLERGVINEKRGKGQNEFYGVWIGIIVISVSFWFIIYVKRDRDRNIDVWNVYVEYIFLFLYIKGLRSNDILY